MPGDLKKSFAASTKRPPLRAILGLPGLLIVLGLLTYFNTISFPFVHDDVVFIKNNPRLAELHLKDIFLNKGLIVDHGPHINIYYRPFLDIFQHLQFRLFDQQPWGYHFCNVLLHSLNAVLIYLVIGKMGRGIFPSWMALIAGMIFLIHPVQSEAVSCVSGVSNLLFAFFCLTGIYSYLSSVQGKGKWKSLGAYLISLLAFSLALLSKEQAVILPAIFILYELIFPDFSTSKRWSVLLRILGYGLILAGYLILRKMVLGDALTSLGSSVTEMVLRISTIPRTLLMYGGTILIPHNLHYYRSVDILGPFWMPFGGFVAVAVTVIYLISHTSGNYKRLSIFGLAWFLLFLFPVLNIVPLITEYSFILTAEHFLYLPIAGFVLFLSSIIGDKLKETDKARLFKPVVWAVFIVTLMVITIGQNNYWRSEIVLFKRALQFEGQLGRVHLLLSRAYFQNGQIDKAIAEGDTALKIMSGYVDRIRSRDVKGIYLGFVKGIHFDMAQYYLTMKDLDSAEIHYEAAIRIDPDDAVLQNNIGVLYLNKDNVEKAMEHFKRAVSLDADNLMAMNNLAGCYFKLNDRVKAAELLRAIMKKDSRFLAAKENLDKLLSERNPLK